MKPLQITLLLLLLILGTGLPRGWAANPPLSAALDSGKTVAVMIELTDEPAAQTYARQMKAARGPALQSVRLQAVTLARAQLARIGQAQSQARAAVQQSPIGARVIYQVQRAYNGMVAHVAPDKIDAIRALPGVRAVHRLSHKNRLTQVSVPFIGAPMLWQGQPGLTGEGIRVGVMDSGIDYIHKDFGGPGTGYGNNDPTIVGDVTGYPSSKVVGGYDFAGDNYDASTPGKDIPVPDSDPFDGGSLGHGTHVAGIIAGYGVTSAGATYAGPYDVNTDSSVFLVGPGVAPGAKLYALRVFGNDGSTDLTEQALDWALDPNNDGDFSDHLDVVNLSLGTDYGLVSDPLVAAVENASQAGMIVVVAAGNAGDGYYILGSPALAQRAISVASSVDGALAWALLVNAPAAIAGDYALAEATFGPTLTAVGITGKLVYADPPLADVPLTNAAAMQGNIALIDRGGNNVFFVDKVKRAQAAGAVAVVMVNNVAGAPFPMGDDPANPDSTIAIPAVMVSKVSGDLIKAQLAAPANVTIGRIRQTSDPSSGDTLSSFSSRGPSSDRSMLKPDVTAPGANIYSAAVGTGTQAASKSGTSMATPHIAGAMALLRQMHPAWSVEQLKALLMNTATHDLFLNEDWTPPRYGPARVGAGRIDLAHALETRVVAGSADDAGAVSVSFGAVETTGTQTYTRFIRVENLGAATATYQLDFDEVTHVPGVSFSFPDGTALSVPPSVAQTFRIQMTVQSDLMKHTWDDAVSTTVLGIARHWISEASGYARLTPDGATTGTMLRVPVYAAPRTASMMQAQENTLALPAGETGSLVVHLAGQGLASGTDYPLDEESLVTPFELLYARPAGDQGFIQYLGVQRQLLSGSSTALSNTVIDFGIATAHDWTSPNIMDVTLSIDSNMDGQPEITISNVDYTIGGWDQDSPDKNPLTITNLGAGATRPGSSINKFFFDARDTRLLDNNVMVFPVQASDLGLTTNASRFQCWVTTKTFGVADNEPDDPLYDKQTFLYDALRPGLTFDAQIYSDQGGTAIPVSYSRSNLTSNGAQGLLLLHHHNAAGHRAETLFSPAPTAAREWEGYR